MKLPTIAVYAAPIALSALYLACTPERQAQASNSPAPVAPSPSGHYCNMGVFTPQQHARLEEQLVPKIVEAVTAKQELEDGYTFTFSGRLNEAGEWLDLVRQCCPTLEYQLTFEARGGPTTLSMHGGPGAKEFIREEFRPILATGS
jgi:hypothetical protein